MVSIAGSKKLKRQMAPTFWGINRKAHRFVVTVRPGPHSRDASIPTAVLLRDTLKIVSTLREAKSTIYRGKVKVDGVKRKSLHHGIGLMDVIELEGVSNAYRMVPKNATLLQPIKISESEKSKKLVKITSKTTIRSGKTSVGFHDGRSLILEAKVKIGDTCLIQIPEQKILDIIPLEKGFQVIITRGVNAGKIGTIIEIKPGTFILQKRVLVNIDDREIEIPEKLIMAVGKDKPAIQIV
ncbi:MAG: 30S ribosomal protein S4e [Nitrosopumilaceae archaeon]